MGVPRTNRIIQLVPFRDLLLGLDDEGAVWRARVEDGPVSRWISDWEPELPPVAKGSRAEVEKARRRAAGEPTLPTGGRDAG